MEYYAGIDVSLEESSVCVVDGGGRIVGEAKVASEPAALIGWFGGSGPRAFADRPGGGAAVAVALRGAGGGGIGGGVAGDAPCARGLQGDAGGRPIARTRGGIAQLMRLGWFRPVHCKSLAAQEVRALLGARKLVQSKRHDVEMSLRGILRGFGLKVGKTTGRSFDGRVRELVAGQATLTVVAEALLAVRGVLARELGGAGQAGAGPRADGRAGAAVG